MASSFLDYWDEDDSPDYLSEDASLYYSGEDEDGRRLDYLNEDALPHYSDDSEDSSLDYSLVSLHQLAEASDPSVAPHTVCQYCAQFVLVLNTGEEAEDQPTVQLLQDHLTSLYLSDARTAASNGCSLFSLLLERASYLVGDGGESRPIWAECEISWGAASRFTVVLHFNIKCGRRPYYTTNILDFGLFTVAGECLKARWLKSEAGSPCRSVAQCAHVAIGSRPLHRCFGNWLPPNIIPDSEISYTRARE
jgi:hypothetical protein